MRKKKIASIDNNRKEKILLCVPCVESFVIVLILTKTSGRRKGKKERGKKKDKEVEVFDCKKRKNLKKKGNRGNFCRFDSCEK